MKTATQRRSTTFDARRVAAALATATLVAIAPARTLHAQSPSATTAERLQLVTLYDSSYQRQRRIWVHVPVGYDARASTTYPLMVAFDGADYRDTIPLPRILDSLAAAHAAPSFVAVLVDDGGGGERIADLGNAPRMVDFIAKQLMPYVRAHWRVTTDPHRAVITGSSAGGLAASYVALERPDLFGNVLSQSGAYWRGANASNSAPYEWLTSRAATLPRRDVRFLLDVGARETISVLGGSGPVFIEAARRFRDALTAKGYPVIYTEVPNGVHAPLTWVGRLPVDIVQMTKAWPAARATP